MGGLVDEGCQGADGQIAMSLLVELQGRLRGALESLPGELSGDVLDEAVGMLRVSQDAKFGDYQANCAMSLGKRLGKPPRDVAGEIVERFDVGDLCHAPEVAGPGFINLKLKEDAISRRLGGMLGDARLGIDEVAEPKTYVVDYSSPNVAKPMHVGHIRSTVIGDSLYRTLKFLGHKVIGDNHIGDWGTQFGMIIYGWRHFADEAAYEVDAVSELARLYRLVNQLVEYQAAKASVAGLRAEIGRQEEALKEHEAEADPKDKKAKKKRRQMAARLEETNEKLAGLEATIAAVEGDATLSARAAEHATIGEDVLGETAKLHAGDAENRALWEKFLPPCQAEIDKVYRRLDVEFDVTNGESFYHERLPAVVEDLREKKLAVESDGALCVFFEKDAPPMIVQKKDGAFLYSTTDLATIQYRAEEWDPDVAIYVVDHRQALHFEHLFEAARRWGYEKMELVHVAFGTVLGNDGRPFRTRSGDTVGLSGLLDEAVERAHAVVVQNDSMHPAEQQLNAEERKQVAEQVGIGALKYADLSQNRTSDYTFSYDKMLAMNGNTATYMQYAYARVMSIVRKGEMDPAEIERSGSAIEVTEPAERALAVNLLRFPEALEAVVADYRPNHLTSYLFELANSFSSFFDQCPVLKAETEAVKSSRFALCLLTAKVIRQGLALLGIGTVERM